MYILVKDNEVVAYPYSLDLLRKNNPQTSFPRAPGDWMVEWGVHPVTPSSPPTYDINFNIQEGTPTNIAGVWTQVWNKIPASAEDIANRIKDADSRATREQIRMDAFVQTFIGYTPEQLEAYIDNNTANLAAIRVLVKRLARIILVLAKSVF